MKKKTNLLFLFGLLFFSCSKEISLNTESLPQSKTELITLKSGVVVEKIGDNYIFEGDIVLSETQLEALRETGDFLPTERPKAITPLQQNEESIKFKNVGLYPTPYNMWAMVRYTFSPGLSSWTKQTITEAIQHWEANTNVRFYNATGQPTVDPTYGFQYPYVEFTQTTSINNSSVGRIGGKQLLNIATWQPTSVVIHEIGHAIGLWHEMSRPDRDNHVTVNINNVPTGNRHNFDKKTTNYSTIGAFDFESIMMYGPFDFAINSNIAVITRKINPTDFNFGDATQLSFNDRIWANSYYIPYIARSDVYAELTPTVYKPDNTAMTASERLTLQAQLNNGNPNPPNCCRLTNNHF